MELSLLRDLGFIIALAATMGLICKKLKLPNILGYIFAGVCLGPHFLGVIKDIEHIEPISQIGLVFIVFFIGLHLSLNKLRTQGITVFLGTALSALLIYNITLALGTLFGLTSITCLFIAGMFMVSSSAIIAKNVKDFQLSREPTGQLALSITVMEDIIAIIVLTLLTGKLQAESNFTMMFGGLTLFIGITVIGILTVLPPLLKRLDKYVDPEPQTLFICGILFTLAWLSTHAGFSLAIGAFLLGSIVADLPQRSQIEKSFLGMKDLFSGVFFAAIGLHINLTGFGSALGYIVLFSVLVILVRSFALSFGLMLAGHDSFIARKAAIAAVPVGEFSFVIAQMGIQANYLAPITYTVVVGVSVCTTILAPWLMNNHQFLMDQTPLVNNLKFKHHLTKYHAVLKSLLTFEKPIWRIIRPQLLRIGGEIIICIGLITAVLPVYKFLHTPIPTQWHLSYSIAYATLFASLLLFPLVGLWRNIEAFLLIIFSNLPNKLSGSVFFLSRWLSTACVCYLLWIFTPSQFYQYGLIFVLSSILSLVLFSRHIIYIYSQWQSSIRKGLAKPKQHMLTDWDLHLGEATIPDDSNIAGDTVEELKLRSEYNCTVVELNRHGFIIHPVAGTQRIYSGDKLTLLGKESDLDIVVQFLENQKSARDIVKTQSILNTLAVNQYLDIAGKSIKDLDWLSRYKAKIVGIGRNGEQLHHPHSSFQINHNDTLLILGTPDAIALLTSNLQPQPTVS